MAALLLAVLPAAQAQNNSVDYSAFNWDEAGQIAVQAGGRVKPLDTFARELVGMIHGKGAYQDQHPVETYFRWMADGDRWSQAPVIYLPKNDLRHQLDLDSHIGSHFSMAELAARPQLMSIAMQGQARDAQGGKPTFTETKAIDLLNRMGALSAVFAHENPLMIPTASDPLAEWQTMAHLMTALDDSGTVKADTIGDKPAISDTLQTLALAFAGMYNAVRDGRSDIFNTAVNVYREAQLALLADRPQTLSRLDWETMYNRVQPFYWARLLLAAGFVVYLISLKPARAHWKSVGLTGLAGGLVLYTAGMAMRAYIAGRAPWSNMYESLLAIGWAVLLLAIIYELVRRDRIFGMIGALLGAAILSVAQFASLDRGINPLVPALQSYWLNYHVIITLSGYAAFALTMGIGHAVLITGVRSRGEVTPGLAALAKANLRIMQVGSLLLVTGILLGAVWANVSWGRFWGWDPKETWALICWFVYIAFLHGRSAGWLGWRGLAAYSVAAFPVVIMTYYGVNYYLSGLHSYGAGSAPGIPWQIFAYLGAEALFLFWALSRLKGTVPRRPTKPKPAVAEPSRSATPTS